MKRISKQGKKVILHQLNNVWKETSITAQTFKYEISTQCTHIEEMQILYQTTKISGTRVENIINKLNVDKGSSLNIYFGWELECQSHQGKS